MQVYLCEKLSLVNEMYFAITLDRTSAGPVCSQTQVFIFSAFVTDDCFLFFLFFFKDRMFKSCFALLYLRASATHVSNLNVLL